MPEIKLSSGSLVDFLKTVLGLPAPDDNGDQAHDDCNCSACQMRRFQVPTPPTGSELHHATRDALKKVVKFTDRAIDSTSHMAADLISQPLSPEAEDIMLQLAVDRVQATVRAQHALNVLLPEDLRAPADILSDPAVFTLESARVSLAKARKLAQEKYDARRIEEQAKRDAREAVEAATQPEAG